MPALTQGQSGTQAVDYGDFLLVENRNSDLATLSYAGVTASRMPTVTQGRQLIGPFTGSGSVTVTATSGGLFFERAAEPGTAPTAVPVADLAAAAAANTAAIQTALNNGSARLVTPGVVYINATLLLDDNIDLYIGSGVTLMLASGSNCSMVKNRRHDDAALATITLSLASGVLVTATWTAHGQPIGTKRWVSINGANQHEYNGVWFATFTTANAFTFTIETDPTTAATGTIQVRWANVNCRVWGPGTLDYNAAGNPSATNSDAHAVKFLHCALPGYAVRQSLNVLKYVVSFSNTSGPTTGDLYFNTISDGVHITGPQRGVAAIGNLDGFCGDDMLSMTCGDYAQFQLSRGEIGHVVAGVIRGDNSSVALVKITGAGGPKVRTVDIAGLEGTSANNLQIIEDGANLTATYVEHLILRSGKPRIGPNGFITVVGGIAGTTVEKVSVSNLRVQETIYGDRCLMRVYTGCTVRHVTFTDSYAEHGATSTGDWLREDAGAVITTRNFVNCEYRCASGNNAMVRGNNAGADTTFFSNVTLTGATGGYLILPGSNSTIFIDGVRSSSTDSPVTPVFSGRVANVYSNGWVHSGSGLVYGVAGSTVNLFGSGSGPSSAPAGNFRCDGDFAQDGAAINAPQVGDRFRNSNAGFGTGLGLYGRSSAPAWVKYA